MALAHSPKIVADGLMLCLDAANLKSYPGTGNTWFDLSGNGRNATLFNGVAFSAEKSGCLDFDDVLNSYATIPHDSEISSQVFGTSTNFTISGWFVMDEYINYGTILQKASGGSYSNSTNGLWVEATNEIRTIIGSNVSSNPTGSTTSVTYTATPGVWYNAVAIGDGTYARLYINGIQVGTPALFSNITVTRTENTDPITIGTRNTESDPNMDGRVAAIYAYNRGLTAQEIQQNFNALRGRYGI